MRTLLLWLHCFLSMLMMMEKILQFAFSYFPSIVTTILKFQQKIQGLKKGEAAKETFKQSPEKDIPKRHSKGKSKKRKMKDSKECLHNVVKYNERDSHEDIYNTKEVPSNGLSDTNLIVRKSRPPERVKWINWISRNKVAMMSLVVICLGQFSGTSAESLQDSLEVKVGQNANMTIPQDNAGNFPFYVRYTSNNNSSDVLKLCEYLDGTLTTYITNSSHLQGISCLRSNVFISEARPHHAGTYSIYLGCTEPNCPIIRIYNLSIIGNEPLLHPVLHPTVETAVNGTNKDAGGGGGGPNVVTIISAVITTSLALVSIVFLVVKCIVPCLHKRRQLSFPWQKSSTSSSAADNDAHCRMITTASKPESESAECC